MMGIIDKCGLRGDVTLCVVIFFKFGARGHDRISLTIFLHVYMQKLRFSAINIKIFCCHLRVY